MKVGIFLFLTTICLANNVAEGVLKDEVTSHYSIPINKPQAGVKILKGPKKKALAKAKAARAKAKASSAGSAQVMDSSILAQVTNSTVTQVIIEPDTPLASLWYPPPRDPEEWRAYFDTLSHESGVKNRLPSPDTQCVYLDFNQRAPYFVSILNTLGEQVGEFGPFHGYDYSKLEQEAILDRLSRDYHLYNVYFTLEKPEDDEPYTTILFNANDFPGYEYAITTVVSPPDGTIEVVSVLFGLAPAIDYLNLIRDDLVRVQGNLWSFLVEIDPTGSLFTTYSGIQVAGPAQLNDALSMAIINQSSNTASHELGHALGLRHHDAFGSPGDGLPITGKPSDKSYYAPYPGPRVATETTLHLMASSEVLGINVVNFHDQAQDDRFFSERSSVKLTFAEGCGHFMTEKEAKRYGAVMNGMEIPEFYVENPLEEGENSGGRYLRIDSVNIAGTIDDVDEVDQYRLYLKKDRVFTAEVISYASSLDDRVMTTLTLFKVTNDGERQVVAANDFGVESFDPQILDFLVPETGPYVLVVAVQQTIPIDRQLDGTFDELFSVKKLGGQDFLTGEYNLLIYNHHDPMQKSKYRPNQEVCIMAKKKGYGSHSSDGDYDDDHSYSKSGHTDDDHTDDDHTDDDHTNDDHTNDEHTDDEHTDDSYSEDSKNLRGRT